MAGAGQRISQAGLSGGLTLGENDAFFQIAREDAAVESGGVMVALPDSDIQQASAKEGHRAIFERAGGGKASRGADGPFTGLKQSRARRAALPYEAVRNDPDPEATLLSFFQSAFDAAAENGRWGKVPPEGSARDLN